MPVAVKVTIVVMVTDVVIVVVVLVIVGLVVRVICYIVSNCSTDKCSCSSFTNNSCICHRFGIHFSVSLKDSSNNNNEKNTLGPGSIRMMYYSTR